MSTGLSLESTAEIKVRLAKAEAIHPQEACRVGMLADTLREVIRLREMLEEKDLTPHPAQG